MPDLNGRLIEFGRVPSPPDDRDSLFPMSLVLEDVPLPPWRYHRLPRKRLDQNGWPECVAFMARHWQAGAPTMTAATVEDARALYRRCKQLDGIPNIDGTYLRVMLKVLQDEERRVGRYLWAQSLKDIKRWVLTTGPVCAGTEWYDGMTNPDAKGVMHPTGQMVGGHAYLIVGYSSIRGMFRILNSWFPSWGQNGQAWIDEEDLWLLVANRGEAVGMQEVRVG